MLIKELVRAGHGPIKSDIVITNARLINVASSEIYPAEVAIKRGHVVAIGDVGHCKGLDRVIHDAKGHYFGPDDHRATHHWPECIGIWETVREFIQGEDDKVFEALEIPAQNKLQVFGCAPMCRATSWPVTPVRASGWTMKATRSKRRWKSCARGCSWWCAKARSATFC